MKQDSELLLSVFVVQLGYASAAQVMAAAAEWATRRKEGLQFTDVLAQRGLLDPERRKMVEALIGKALQVNEGDVGRTLQSFSHGLNTLMRAISSSMVNESVQTRPTPQGDSLEGSENVSDEPIGRYDFEAGPDGEPEELGRGGIGRVVVAHDRFLGRDVAMKELLVEHVSNPELATTRLVALEQRFLREARLTGQLEHPAIVPVFELGRRLNGGLYYTMQRVRGRTMYQLMREARTLEGRLKLVSSYLTTCQAIAYAHSRAVVHRDIKPQNIMVGPFGETYVLDWGLARVKGRSDPRAKDLKLQPDITGNVLEGGAIGTPSYMSPEQAEGKVEAIDERSDVWCLGAVLYELLTGEPPYTGVNPFDVLGKIIKDKVRPVRTLQPEAPIELVAIAEKALQHDKAARYASAAEMAKDVSAWLQGGRVAAHDYTSVELIRRFARKNKIVLTLGSGFAVALLLLAGVAYRQVLRERDEAERFADLFLFDVSDKLAPIAGSGPLVKQLTSKTLEYYRTTVDPKTASRERRLKLCLAFKKIGRLAYDTDQNGEAESAYGYALDVARPLVDEQPTDAAARVLLSEALIGLSDVAGDQGDSKKCEALILEAIGHGQAAVDADPNNIQALDTLSRGHSRLASMRQTTGRFAEAVEPSKKSVEVDLQLERLQPNSEEMQQNVAISTTGYAELLVKIGKLDEAVKLCDEGVAKATGTLGRHPDSLRSLRIVTSSHLQRADLAKRQGDAEHARTSLQRAYEYGRTLAAKEPNDSEGRQFLSRAELETGRGGDAYDRLHAMGEAAYDADTIELYVLAMLFTHRYDEALGAVPRAQGTKKKQVATVGALAAALKGDATTSSKLATEAAHAELIEMTWPLEMVSAWLEKPATPLASAAWSLAKQIDVAQRKVDAAAVDLALLQYAHDVAER